MTDLRKWINLLEGATPPTETFDLSSYDAELPDNYAIAEYIESHSVSHTDVGMIEDYVHGCKAVLKMLPVSTIQPGSANANVRIKSREAKYKKLSLSTMPPLVVELHDGVVTILDGNHRFRVAVAKGATEIPCYVVEEE